MFLKIIVDSGLEFAVGIAYGYVEQFGCKGDRRDDVRIKVRGKSIAATTGIKVNACHACQGRQSAH